MSSEDINTSSINKVKMLLMNGFIKEDELSGNEHSKQMLYPMTDLSFNMHYFFGQFEDMDIEYFENLDKVQKKLKEQNKDPIIGFLNSSGAMKSFEELVEKLNPEERHFQNMIDLGMDRNKFLGLLAYENYLNKLIWDNEIFINEKDSITTEEIKRTIFELRILGAKLNKSKDINRVIDLTINSSLNISNPDVLSLSSLYDNNYGENFSIFYKLTTFNIKLSECLKGKVYEDMRKLRHDRIFDFISAKRPENKVLVKDK